MRESSGPGSLGQDGHSAAEPPPKGGSPCFSSFNTEPTEYLRDLGVEADLSTEVTETVPEEGKIFAAFEEVDTWYFGAIDFVFS